MTYLVKTSVPFVPCKSLWRLTHSQELPQQQQVQNFIRSHSINNVAHVVDAKNLQHRDMHVLIINQHYWSLEYLAETVIKVSEHSTKYLWVAINKFLIYNTTQLNNINETNWDLNLLKFVENQIPNWTVLDKICRPDDRGTLGNFEYPVTGLVAKRHEQKSL